MKSIARILGVSLVALLTLGVATGAAAQGAVTNAIIIDTNGDLPGFLALFKRSQAIAQRLGTPAPRLLQATLAGEQTNQTVITIEHANLVALAQALTKQQADAEWQKLIADAQSKGIVSTSNVVWNEITPAGGPAPMAGKVLQWVVLGGDAATVVDTVTKARAINERLGTGGSSRLFQAGLAGEQTGTRGVAVEYASLEAWAKGATLQAADAEWQKLIADAQAKGLTPTSNQLFNDITP
jgi:hypothetical protein